MKFGLESERFLFDLKHNKPSEGVLRFIEALSDIGSDTNAIGCITNEFVLNMVELVTAPSDSPLEVIKEYLKKLDSFNIVVSRENVAIIGLGSLPVKFQPHMIPKKEYFFQNSILNHRIGSSWMIDESSPLTPAGNCAGIHIHSEIETSKENLYSTRELQDKFNLGLMLTPMVAVSSSPFFFGEHEASSMRSHRYFSGVYRLFPLNGGLPHVMNSSEEVLRFTERASESWLHKGLSIGLPADELITLVNLNGANWNPIRWNKTWNTVELRCLDSDRVDLDCSKFIWVTSAMKRLDIKSEALTCRVLNEDILNHHLIEKCFKIRNNDVAILSTKPLYELFQRASLVGIHDPFVAHYLERVAEFSEKNIQQETRGLFDILVDILKHKNTTSENMLNAIGRKKSITQNQAVEIVLQAIEEEKVKLEELFQLKPLSFARIQNKDLFDPINLAYS